ncbi:ABC transporter substrate-binding protein [Halomonas sp. G15]|uniref:ABC transporter substrate-binding protein n=1 Tax=Halomonas sp. G15 TaxID=2903521 RepID=UPI001E4D3E87|nr:ABC transporter substrate-binding protein [Halomonas sp. G15]MCE0734581.1 ABC transporter substrate-binding protein [Halomonas sp. G15]
MKKTLLAASVATMMLGATPVMAKTLVFCSEGSPEGFDPSLYTTGTTFDAASKTIYNRLIEFKTGTTELRPAIAESWEVSDDGMEVTFHLRDDIEFHTTDYFTPSRPLNADDVLYSFRRQMEEDNAFYQHNSGNYEYFNAMSMGELIDEIVKVDDHTVRFVLTRPEAPFLANLAMDFASIHSKEYGDQLLEAGTPERANRQPIGTGPFQLVGYQEDAVIRYAANPDYFRNQQPLDNLVFAITPDAQVRYQKLQAGECHVMPYPNPSDIDEMKQDDSLQVLEEPGLNVAYLAYNTRQEPFDDPQVRKALNMAINKEAIIEAVFQGAGEVAKNPIPPTMWGYNEAIEDDPYDPQKAEQMLEDAGVEDLEMNIWAMPVQRPYMPNARRTAELMQADLSQIGVDAEIVTYEWGEYLKRASSVDREGAVILGWTGDNGDPDNFLAVLLGCDGVGGANRAQWCHEPFDELVMEAKTLSDQAERVERYEQAQAIFKEQAPWNTLAHSVVFMPLRKEVTGYTIDPLGGHSFEGVDLK